MCFVMIAFKQFAIDVTWFCWLEEEQKLGIFRCVWGESKRERAGEGAAGQWGDKQPPGTVCGTHERLSKYSDTQV